MLGPTKRTARVEANIKRLTAAGWDHSEFTSRAVCVLNRNLAFVSATERQLRKDGGLIAEEGNVSLLAKMPEGWKMVARFASPPGKTVTCDRESAPTSAPIQTAEQAAVLVAGRNYVGQFSMRNFHGVSYDVYNQPAVQIGPKEVAIIDPVKQEQELSESATKLAAGGWNKTEFSPGALGCLINPDVGLASGPILRFDANNKQIGEGGRDPSVRAHGVGMEDGDLDGNDAAKDDHVQRVM